MIYRPLLDSFAMALGYGFMFITGLSAALFILSIAMDWWWRKLKDAHSFTDLCLAMDDYKRKRSALKIKGRDDD